MAVDMEARVQNIIDRIVADVEESNRLRDLTLNLQPDKQAIIRILQQMQVLIFPVHFGRKKKISDFGVRYELGSVLEEVYSTLVDQITLALLHEPAFNETEKQVRREKGERVAGQFLDRIPKLRESLKKDLEAAYQGDPAAFNRDEIVFSYPGFYAIMVNRIAHELYLLNVPLIPRIMTEYAHGLTGADIHPGATLGEYFFIDHATGVVIGETTIIGDWVKIYQGVTLGGLSTRGGQSLKGSKRHPTIGNQVTIYSNASILGGETVIGDDCIIGGNCFITQSIPAHSRVSFQSPELHVKRGRQAVETVEQ